MNCWVLTIILTAWELCNYWHYYCLLELLRIACGLRRISTTVEGWTSGFITPRICLNLSVARCSYLLTRQHNNYKQEHTLDAYLLSYQVYSFIQVQWFWRLLDTDILSDKKTDKLNTYRFSSFDNDYWRLTDMYGF